MTGVEAAVVSAIVSGILKNVGNKLAPQLIKKYSSIVGVKKDLQELQVIVEEINSQLERVGDHAMGVMHHLIGSNSWKMLLMLLMMLSMSSSLRLRDMMLLVMVVSCPNIDFNSRWLIRSRQSRRD